MRFVLKIPNLIYIFFCFHLGFTPCKAEQPLQGMELQEKAEIKDSKHTGKLFRKTDKRYLLIRLKFLLAI